MKIKTKTLFISFLAFLTTNAFAEDILANALNENVHATLGSGSTLWKIMLLVDVVLSTVAAVKTKNPMAFLGVFFVLFIPGMMIERLVFN